MDDNVFVALSAGETTITVTTDRGLTDNCVITVTEPKTIALDETVTIPEDTTLHFRFTAEESGEFCFISDADYGLSLNISGSYTDYERINSDIHVEMDAGDTCRLDVVNYADRAETITLKKCVEIQSISFNNNGGLFFEGNNYNIFVDYSSRNFIRESCAWTSSNPEVAQVNGGVLSALSAGETTVTVTASNGVFSSADITINAVESISVGFQADIQGSIYYEKQFHYKFTAPSSGKYIFHEKNNGYFSGIVHVTENMGFITSGSSVVIDAVEGRTYSITVGSWDSRRYTLCLEEVSPLTGIQMETSAIIGYAGTLSWQQVGIKPIPSNAVIGEISCLVADTDIATADFFGLNDIRLNLLQPGTTELIFTEENGFTVSVPIESVAPEAIRIDEGREFSLLAGEDLVVQFTSQEAGDYVFWTTDNDFESEITIYPWEDNRIGDTIWGKNRAAIYLEEGESCVARICGSNNLIEGKLYVAKAVEMIQFQLDRTEYTGQIGCSAELKATSFPANALMPELTWESSAPSVAKVVPFYDSSEAAVLFDNPGSAVITVTTDNGISASCSITVEEPETIEVGFDRRLSVSRDSMYAFRFTASKDGWYRFWGDPSDGFVWSEINGTISIFDETDGYNIQNDSSAFYAIADHVYCFIVKTLSWDDTVVITATYHLEECVPLQKLGLTEYGYTNLIVGDFIHIQYNLEPMNTNEKIAYSIEGNALRLYSEGTEEISLVAVERVPLLSPSLQAAV